MKNFLFAKKEMDKIRKMFSDKGSMSPCKFCGEKEFRFYNGFRLF